MKTLLIPHFLFQEQLPFGRIKVLWTLKTLLISRNKGLCLHDSK